MLLASLGEIQLGIGLFYALCSLHLFHSARLFRTSGCFVSLGLAPAKTDSSLIKWNLVASPSSMSSISPSFGLGTVFACYQLISSNANKRVSRGEVTRYSWKHESQSLKQTSDTPESPLLTDRRRIFVLVGVAISETTFEPVERIGQIFACNFKSSPLETPIDFEWLKAV